MRRKAPPKLEPVIPKELLEQAKRYSRGAANGSGNWNGFRVPFLYATNGEIIWHLDVRLEKLVSRINSNFHTATALAEKFAFDDSKSRKWLLDTPPERIIRLRPYQVGSIVATEAGVSNNYGLVVAQGRGKLFMSAGVAVYEGMVVGENAKEGDVLVHVAREKQLTNFRAKNEGLADQLEVPVIMGLEDALDYISDDELVEVTPEHVRIRKKYLNENDRKKAGKNW